MDGPLVYMIQVGRDGPVKIGVSVDPEARLTALQVSHHEHLRLVAVYPGGVTLEGMIHKDYADARIRGEWFRPTPELERLARGFQRNVARAEDHGWCSRCSFRSTRRRGTEAAGGGNG